MISDLEHDELRSYLPRLTAQDDFDQFWAKSIAEAAEADLDARFEPVETHLATIDSYDVSFRGYGGHVIRGWLNLPKHRDGPLPCVVEYIGYTGGRGNAQDWLLWSAAGYAHFVMDTRGQAGGSRNGDTPDPAPVGSAHYPGFMTLGIETPETYYYRRVYIDAARAIDAAQLAPGVDPNAASRSPARVRVAASPLRLQACRAR